MFRVIDHQLPIYSSPQGTTVLITLVSYTVTVVEYEFGNEEEIGEVVYAEYTVTWVQNIDYRKEKFGQD